MVVDRWMPIEHVKVADQWVAVASRDEIVAAAQHDCKTARGHGRVRTRLIFDANGQGISLAQTNSSFRFAVDAADIVHADGQFVVLMSRIFCAKPIPERSSTTDLIHDVARMAEIQGFSFYLLGGEEKINAECAEILKKNYPKLNLVGRRNGYFRGRDEEVLRDIDQKAPDILWVGLGKPYEQEFCLNNRLRINAVWTVTCGGCFNYITGAYKRAPRWMQRFGLEWFHRMVTQPRKLLWRYITTSPHAVIIALFRSSREIKSLSLQD